MKKHPRKVNATGRNESEQYTQIPYTMARHPAWRSLGGAAVKVWVELRSRFNGRNNGELSLSVDEGARLLGMSKTTVLRALKELETKGFIKMTRQGQWYGRMATTWAVTDRRHQGNLPTCDWKNWRPIPKPLKKQDLGTEMKHIRPKPIPRKTGSRYCGETYSTPDGFTRVPKT